MAGTLNLVFTQGEDWSRTFTYKVDGTAVNLTNHSALFQVRQSSRSTTTAVSLSNGSGITLGGSAGTIAVTIPAATINAMSGVYVYELRVGPTGSPLPRLLSGTVEVSEDIAR